MAKPNVLGIFLGNKENWDSCQHNPLSQPEMTAFGSLCVIEVY